MLIMQPVKIEYVADGERRGGGGGGVLKKIPQYLPVCMYEKKQRKIILKEFANDASRWKKFILLVRTAVYMQELFACGLILKFCDLWILMLFPPLLCMDVSFVNPTQAITGKIGYLD